MKVVLCPVCNGSGVVLDQNIPIGGSSTSPYTKQCHGCGGKGWVEVIEDLPHKEIG